MTTPQLGEKFVVQGDPGSPGIMVEKADGQLIELKPGKTVRVDALGQDYVQLTINNGEYKAPDVIKIPLKDTAFLHGWDVLTGRMGILKKAPEQAAAAPTVGQQVEVRSVGSISGAFGVQFDNGVYTMIPAGTFTISEVDANFVYLKTAGSTKLYDWAVPRDKEASGFPVVWDNMVRSGAVKVTDARAPEPEAPAAQAAPPEATPEPEAPAGPDVKRILEKAMEDVQKPTVGEMFDPRIDGRPMTPEELEVYREALDKAHGWWNMHRPYTPQKSRRGPPGRGRRGRVMLGRWARVAERIGKRAGVRVGDELVCIKQVMGENTDGSGAAVGVFEPDDHVIVKGIGRGITVERENGEETLISYANLKFFQHVDRFNQGKPTMPEWKVGDEYVVAKATGQLEQGAQVRITAPAMGGGAWLKVNERQIQVTKDILDNLLVTGTLVPKGHMTMAGSTRTAQTHIDWNEYEKEIREQAQEIFDEYVADNGGPPSYSGDFDDDGKVHEAVDGHQWIIYNQYHESVNDNARGFGCKDPDISGLVDGSIAENDPDAFCSSVGQIRAYEAMKCSIFSVLQELIDDYEEEEEDEEEEELSGDLESGDLPAGGADPRMVADLQRYYDMGQKAQPGASPPGNLTPAQTEAFQAGNYDWHGSGFGPAPQKHRQVTGVDPTGRPIIARWRRRASDDIEKHNRPFIPGLEPRKPRRPLADPKHMLEETAEAQPQAAPGANPGAMGPVMARWRRISARVEVRRARA